MLMLQSLKCRSTNTAIPAKYDEFSAKKHHLIVNYDNQLKTRFMRDLGIVEGQAAYQAFSTKVANSHAALRQSPGSCDMADGLLTLAINASDAELPALARSFSEMPVGVGELCSAAPAVPVETATAAEVGPAPAPVAVSTPAVTVTPAAPSPAAALEAAALALQSAAASLKAQSAPAPVAPAAAASAANAPAPVT